MKKSVYLCACVRLYECVCKCICEHKMKCQKLCSMGYWIQYCSWQCVYWPQKSWYNHRVSNHFYPAFIHTRAYAHFQLRIWFRIQTPQQQSVNANSLDTSGICNVQKFIDKCLAINFHDNIFIFALLFPIFFSHIDFFYIYFPSHSKRTLVGYALCVSVYCLLCLHLLSRLLTHQLNSTKSHKSMHMLCFCHIFMVLARRHHIKYSHDSDKWSMLTVVFGLFLFHRHRIKTWLLALSTQHFVDQWPDQKKNIK